MRDGFVLNVKRFCCFAVSAIGSSELRDSSDGW